MPGVDNPICDTLCCYLAFMSIFVGFITEMGMINVGPIMDAADEYLQVSHMHHHC